MSVLKSLMYGVAMPFCFEEAGGEGAGGAGGGGEAGDAGGSNSGATDDGTGGRTNMFGNEGGDKGGDGGEGDKGGETGKVNMSELLGEELAGNKNFEKFASAENPMQEMAKSYLELQSKMGQPQIGVPDENTSAEDAKAFWTKLGVPEDAKGYEFEKPEGMDDSAYNREHAEKWAGLLHKHNIPKEAANELRNEMFKEQAEMETTMAEALNEKLADGFGENKGAMIEKIKQAGIKYVDEETRTLVEGVLDGEKTAGVALFIGNIMKGMEKEFGQTDKNTGDDGETGGKSVDELREESKKLMASDAYKNPMHKDHKDTVARSKTIYKEIAALQNNAKS